jgi:hypothetical protein
MIKIKKAEHQKIQKNTPVVSRPKIPNLSNTPKN